MLKGDLKSRILTLADDVNGDKYTDSIVYSHLYSAILGMINDIEIEQPTYFTKTTQFTCAAGATSVAFSTIEGTHEIRDITLLERVDGSSIYKVPFIRENEQLERINTTQVNRLPRVYFVQNNLVFEDALPELMTFNMSYTYGITKATFDAYTSSTTISIIPASGHECLAQKTVSMMLVAANEDARQTFEDMYNRSMQKFLAAIQSRQSQTPQYGTFVRR